MTEPTTEASRTLLRRPQRAWPKGHDEWSETLAIIEAEARADPCPHCDPRHEWPCPTIPRCDEPGCEQETTCGWPSPTGYRRTCGEHWRAAIAREYAKETP